MKGLGKRRGLHLSSSQWNSNKLNWKKLFNRFRSCLINNFLARQGLISLISDQTKQVYTGRGRKAQKRRQF